jgi:hypothetical protein
VRDLASVQSLSAALMGYDPVTFLQQHAVVLAVIDSFITPLLCRTAVRDLASVQSLSSALVGYDPVTFLQQHAVLAVVVAYTDKLCYTAAVQDCCA